MRAHSTLHQQGQPWLSHLPFTPSPFGQSIHVCLKEFYSFLSTKVGKPFNVLIEEPESSSPSPPPISYPWGKRLCLHRYSLKVAQSFHQHVRNCKSKHAAQRALTNLLVGAPFTYSPRGGMDVWCRPRFLGRFLWFLSTYHLAISPWLVNSHFPPRVLDDPPWCANVYWNLLKAY